MNLRFVGAASAAGAPAADVLCASAAVLAARPAADRSLRLSLFTPSEMLAILTKRIPCKPTKDIYDISVELIRAAAVQLSPVLADLYNQCLREGTFPTPLKVSKISPLFKGKGKRENLDGYRPVSIIPAVAKIMENGLSERLSKYLTSINALSERQYAYRAGRSTIDLAREVVRRVIGAREGGLQVAVLCCDLSKAFDVADHAVLGAKLRHYGIEGPPHALLADILRDRSQVVAACGGNVTSDALTTTMGVAQGSSVSNILFSLLLNDLPEALTAGEAFMYADDVACVVTAHQLTELEEKLNAAATQLSRWFGWNGLALNLNKTHFLHFHLGGRVPRPLVVAVGTTQLEKVRSTTFLGLELDRGLTWEPHITTMCGKLGGACFALQRLARVVPRQVARSCYFATVHSLLQYGAELWGRAAEWERAFRMQKRAVRAIVQVPQDVSAQSHISDH
ncbi:hypothetical protein O0L34_g17345 [Tuta absoluta]|nr:hypothetical protein O0L34_g17345 [Tuta absoluta]